MAGKGISKFPCRFACLPKQGYVQVMNLPERIVIRGDLLMGKPCIRGTRIPVYLLRQKMAAGETEADLLRTYPQLTAADLQACIDQNSQALASVKQGLKESAEGKRIYRGSFAKHAKE
jgi:uncharacterized protein (DUF433 family)